MSEKPEHTDRPYNVLRSFLWVTGGRLLAALTQALTMVIVARGLAPEHFGVVSAFIGVTTVLQTATDLGVSAYALKIRAAYRHDPIVGLCLQIYQRLGLVLCTTLVAAGIALALRTHAPWWWFLPLACGMAFERQADMRLNLAVADGDTWKNASVLVVRRLIALGLLLVLTPLLGTVESYGVAVCIAAAASWVASTQLIEVAYAQPAEPTTAQELKRGVLRSSRPFWADSFMAQVRNLDAMLVTTVTTPAQAGYYGAVSRSISPLRMIGTSVAAVMMPAAVKSGPANRKAKRRVLLILFTGLSIMYPLLAITAPTWVVTLLGPNYAMAVPGFQIVLIGLIFDGVSSVINAVMLGSGLEKIVAWSVTFASIVGLCLVALGGWLHGATGAAVGLTVSYILQLIIMLICGGHLFFGRDIHHGHTV